MNRKPRRVPFTPPSRTPYRSRNSTKPSGGPRQSRTGFIDQNLINGSHVRSNFDQFRLDEDDTRFPEPESPPRRDDDIELDAFDLELLAQSDRASANHPLLPGFGNVARPSSYQTEPLSRNGSSQTSRFFNSTSRITPSHGFESSSSGPEIGLPSSPLTRMTSGKASGGIQSASYEPSSSQLNRELLFSGPQVRRKPFENIPLSIRGIVLLPVSELQDRFRPLFDFPLFNAIQSKCFPSVYNSDDNIVLSAPTGSGKTVIMELAICRLLDNLKNERFKVIYQAPTKCLCSERFRDWNRKFAPLGLQCAELTGDTDYSHLRSIQNSQIIITTPEKWDSMTRKWKDHARLMQLVKLFLIDEVHILKEARGATLEAVVSRMKTFGSNVRFVALSATVPNSEDIATWLGKDATNQHVPAHREHFGEDFRPVKLQKFVYGYQSSANDFAFDKMCNSKLSDVIATHSCGKPIMIFCSTRNSTVTTAKELSRWWSNTSPPARLWKGPGRRVEVHNFDLKATIVSGVAFHHAGLDPADRHTIETGFLQGQISIICCTSTLAVGVNLPCHMVIIKNTVGWQEGGCKEYSDLEMMQMLGRAGRPQFDDSAIAVILTRKERVVHYERLVSGSESLESCLHLNLIDHLNAEIGLGNVTNMESAVRWLAGTFLFARLRRNPTHYKLKEGADKRDEDEMLRQICEKDIKLLQDCGLVSSENLKSTQFGDAMARYYVRFETMKTLLTLKPQASLSQILSVISQAEEFRDIRLKSGEKSLYKEINRASSIRFPVKVDIAIPAHKISLIIQAELGAVDFPDGEQFQKHKFPFQQDKTFVFTHITRLIRCVIDSQICLEDSIATRNALELARSFGARVWDDSPLQMKQVDQIGIVAVRKLAGAGITSLEILEQTEAHQIDMILSKNPPFGVKLLSRLSDFPKLRVSVKMTGTDIRPSHAVKVRFKAEIAFMNEKVPTFFQRHPIYVCFLAETSDGHMIDFRRISASKVGNGHEIVLMAELKGAGQYITCYAMCDDIAGTIRCAEMKPKIPAISFPPRTTAPTNEYPEKRPRMNSSRPRSNDISCVRPKSHHPTDIFDGDDLDLDDFLAADQDTDWTGMNQAPRPIPSHVKVPASKRQAESAEQVQTWDTDEPVQLQNGRWACNHKCKDKSICKHFCCRDGLEKPPKPTRKRPTTGVQGKGQNQLTLSANITKRVPAPAGGWKGSVKQNKGQLGNVSEKPEFESQVTGVPERQVRNSGASMHLPTSRAQKETYPERIGYEKTAREGSSSRSRYRRVPSSDFGDDSFDDLPSPSALLDEVVERPARFTGVISQRAVKKDNEVNIFDELLGTIDSPSADDQSHHHRANSPAALMDMAQQTTRPNSPSPFECGTQIDSPNHSRHDLDPDIRSSIVSSMDLNSPNAQKRKHPFPDDNKENTEKRMKHCVQPNMPSKESEDISILESTPSNKNPSIDLQTHTPTGVQKGWEDIDPILLDEFKDIVNFF